MIASDATPALSSFRPLKRNPNRHNDRGLRLLDAAMVEDGYVAPMTAVADGEIIDGSARFDRALQIFAGVTPIVIEHDGTRPIITKRIDIPDASAPIARRIALRANRVPQVNLTWDAEVLRAELDALPDLSKQLWNPQEIKELFRTADVAEAAKGVADPHLERAAELQRKWETAPGQIWRLGRHRLMCGDSTSPENVAALMNGELVGLLHADPPYGMGKASDGVDNDNLRGSALDTFQVSWWRAARPHLQENASAYVWGNAPELWRLWWLHLVNEPGPLTIRNEIVWDKGNSSGMASPLLHCFANATERCLFFGLRPQFECGSERCLFFMLGDQFMGARRSRAMQRAKKLGEAQRQALLERIQAERSFFDNAREPMTDVWQFGRVLGDDRWGHATPKPISMIARCLLTSLPAGGLCYEPFNGSGSTLMSAEVSDRRCCAMELRPDWIGVTLERWLETTGTRPELVQ